MIGCRVLTKLRRCNRCVLIAMRNTFYCVYELVEENDRANLTTNDRESGSQDVKDVLEKIKIKTV